jgi:hypothetical protein
MVFNILNYYKKIVHEIAYESDNDWAAGPARVHARGDSVGKLGQQFVDLHRRRVRHSLRTEHSEWQTARAKKKII